MLTLTRHEVQQPQNGEFEIDTYSKDTERHMQAFYRTLSEKERRRYAAVEAEKLGHGGKDYISRLFQINPKTILRGLNDLDDEQALSESRERKKGAVARAKSNNTQS